MNTQRARVKALVACVAAGLLLAIQACGGGGGGAPGGASDGSNAPVPGDGGAPSGPAFAGFDFALQAGDFWEYRWDQEERHVSESGGSTATDSGRFRLTLGPPQSIGAVTAFPIQVSGKSTGLGLGGSVVSFTPRWTHLAVADNRILGSSDGATLVTLFDAQTGAWPGSGFFATFPADTLFVAQEGTINNDYINTPAIAVSRSASKDQCEVILGIPICGDESFTDIQRDFYLGGIGPIGYDFFHSHSHSHSHSFSGGGFFDAFSTDQNVGLVLSSLRGDVADHVLEREANDSPSTAQAMTFGTPSATVIGDTRRGDPASLNASVNANDGDRSGNVEDWYTFNVFVPPPGIARSVTITLSVEPGNSTDLDLYLFAGSATGAFLQASTQDNTVSTETITRTLATGTYTIGVQAWDTPSGRVEYTLELR